jgi:hypothetical protein
MGLTFLVQVGPIGVLRFDGFFATQPSHHGARTRPTESVAVRVYARIGGRPLVATAAVAANVVWPCFESAPPEMVLGVRNWLEVIRTNAGPVPA